MDGFQAEAFGGQVFLHQRAQFDVVVYDQYVIHSLNHLTPSIGATQ
jgi:hypothetical protein